MATTTTLPLTPMAARQELMLGMKIAKRGQPDRHPIMPQPHHTSIKRWKGPQEEQPVCHIRWQEEVQPARLIAGRFGLAMFQNMSCFVGRPDSVACLHNVIGKEGSVTVWRHLLKWPRIIYVWLKIYHLFIGLLIQFQGELDKGQYILCTSDADDNENFMSGILFMSVMPHFLVFPS